VSFILLISKRILYAEQDIWPRIALRVRDT
jgi:hypothetical protein